MSRGRRLKAFERQLIREWHEKGRSIEELAIEFGVLKRTISMIVYGRKGPRYYRRLTDLKKQQIERRAKNGESYSVIADELDISQFTVSKYMRSKNIHRWIQPDRDSMVKIYSEREKGMSLNEIARLSNKSIWWASRHISTEKRPRISVKDREDIERQVYNDVPVKEIVSRFGRSRKTILRIKYQMIEKTRSPLKNILSPCIIGFNLSPEMEERRIEIRQSHRLRPFQSANVPPEKF